MVSSAFALSGCFCIRLSKLLIARYVSLAYILPSGTYCESLTTSSILVLALFFQLMRIGRVWLIQRHVTNCARLLPFFFFPVCFPDSSVQRNKGFFITFLKLTPSLKQLFELQPSGVCRSIARPGKKEGRERQMGGAASDQVDQVVMWTEDLKCRSGGVQCCSETELQVTWSNVYRCGWACSVCTLCEARQTNCSTHIQATAKMRSSWLCVLISSFLFLCCCFFQFQAENNPSPRCLEVGTWIAPAGWPYR